MEHNTEKEVKKDIWAIAVDGSSSSEDAFYVFPLLLN